MTSFQRALLAKRFCVCTNHFHNHVDFLVKSTSNPPNPHQIHQVDFLIKSHPLDAPSNYKLSDLTLKVLFSNDGNVIWALYIIYHHHNYILYVCIPGQKNCNTSCAQRKGFHLSGAPKSNIWCWAILSVIKPSDSDIIPVMIMMTQVIARENKGTGIGELTSPNHLLPSFIFAVRR